MDSSRRMKICCLLWMILCLTFSIFSTNVLAIPAQQESPEFLEEYELTLEPIPKKITKKRLFKHQIVSVKNATADTPMFLQYGDLLKTGAFSIVENTELSDGYAIRIFKDDALKDIIKFDAGTNPKFSMCYGSGSYRVELYVHLEDLKYYFKERLVFDFDATQVDNAPYLQSTFVVPVTDEIRTIAIRETLGAQNIQQTLYALEKYLASEMYYDITKLSRISGSYYCDPLVSLDRGDAICVDYATSMTALLRSLSIPCRMVWGSYNGFSHAWVEVNIDGKWCIVDPTGADSPKGFREDYSPSGLYAGERYY